MKKQFRAATGMVIIIMFITFVVCPGLYATDEILPTPEEIIAKNIEARGGIKTLKSIKTKKMFSIRKFVPMNVETEVTEYYERPNNYYKIDNKGIRVGSNGKMAWIINPQSGARLLKGDELSGYLFFRKFDGIDGPNVPWKSMKTEGIERINEKDCYKVVKTSEKGIERTVYYDKESFMIVKTIGNNKIEGYTEEYKKINGILFPYKQVGYREGKRGEEITWEKIELNIKMPEGIFDIPEEVKAIMNKNLTGNEKKFDGTWIGTVPGPDGNPLEVWYVFEAHGEVLRGTVNTIRGGGSFAEGRIDGDKISFTANTGQSIIEWTGTISGDVINMIQKNGDNVKEYILKRAKERINSSTTAFSVSEKDLIPEGITYDPVGQAFYLSSLYKNKIIKIDNKGNRSDFTKERQDGLRPVLGMKVDPKNRSLWVCSCVSSPNCKNFNPDEMGWSGVFKYNIDTGLLQKKYTLHEPGKPHLFNDLVVLDNEDVYVTDSADLAVYKISAKSDKPELFVKSDLFTYPNGIALSDDRKSLFVASGMEIVKIDIASRAVRQLDHADNVITAYIDGLYHYNNSLIGVQNGLNRISRFYLDPEETGLLRSEILEIGNPQFNSPTTGVVVGDKFYYIANSQLRSFDGDGNIFPEEQLEEVLVFQMTLDN